MKLAPSSRARALWPDRASASISSTRASSDITPCGKRVLYRPSTASAFAERPAFISRRASSSIVISSPTALAGFAGGAGASRTGSGVGIGAAVRGAAGGAAGAGGDACAVGRTVVATIAGGALVPNVIGADATGTGSLSLSPFVEGVATGATAEGVATVARGAIIAVGLGSEVDAVTATGAWIASCTA